ncbi:TetR/AcrR family transcriptional regulator [Streptomyces coeruleorubidus]|uniref:TetR/AcrR family transcriptional regulator n=1 Tax=Streptomyces coeruleorubidus TaxID=116188 RepID=UPI0033B48CD7
MSSAPRETGARARTRRATLSAAANVLCRRRDATLAEIATDVGRSTLQRYFLDREKLASAVVEDSLQRLEHSLKKARTDESPPMDALRQLVTAMLDVGDRVLFLYGDPRITDALAEPDGPDPAAEEFGRLIRHGQAARALDPEVSSDWIEQVMWAHVSSGCVATNRGNCHVTAPPHGSSARWRTASGCAAPDGRDETKGDP